MKPTRDLRRVQRSASRRLERLRFAVDDCLTSPTAPTRAELDRTMSHAVIELHNLWLAFSRSLYLSSAFRARDGSGYRVALSKVSQATTVDEALTPAIRRTRPDRKSRKPPWNWNDEPRWADVNVLLNSLDEIGASNLPTVSAGLSTGSLVFVTLGPVRNFYAHRGEDTSQRASKALLRYLVPGNVHPTNALTRHVVVGGVPKALPLVVEWIDDIGLAIDLVV